MAKVSKRFYVNHLVRPVKKHLGAKAFFVDDWPILRQLMPVGVGVKHLYTKRLSEAFANPETRHQMVALMHAFWETRQENKHNVSFAIRCQRPLGQNVMMGFQTFIETHIQDFLNNFIPLEGTGTLNENGADWVDGAVVGDLDAALEKVTTENPQT